MQSIDISGLDGRLLRLFLAVYDRGSVSRAADDLDLTQSTVSHGLDRLRSILNDPLFVRVGRGIQPSEGAALLEPRIRQIVSEMEGLVLRDDYRPFEDRSPITIACNTTELMPELVMLKKRIVAEAPLATIRLIDLGDRSNTARRLETGEADLVIAVRLPSYPASVLHEPWLYDRLVVFYDPTCRGPVESIEDYAAAPHASLDFGGGKQSHLAVALAQHPLERKVVLSAANIYVLAAMMVGTDMITTMQSRFAQVAFRDLAWCELPLPVEKIIYDLSWHRRREASPRIQWLLGLLRGAAPGDFELRKRSPPGGI
ncbi:MAG: LysR family transcriptional regulator [Pseudomonadota bacterium]